MRDVQNKVLKAFFYENLIFTRHALGYTQEKMAEVLLMDIRSYIDLDHGKTGCSALTFALFLIYCCPDPNIFLNNLKTEFESTTNVVA